MRKQTISQRSDSDQSISDEEDFNASHFVYSPPISDKKEGLLLQSRLEILRAKEKLSGEKNSNLLHGRHLLEQDEVEAPDFPDDGELNISTRAEYIQSAYKDACHTNYIIPKDTAACAAGQSCEKANVPSLAGEVRHEGLPMKKYIISRDTAASTAGQSCQEVHVPILAGAVKHKGWSVASKEASALIHLNETSCSSLRQTGKSSKGVKGRTKQRFSFRFQPSIYRKENVSVSKFHGSSDPPEAIQDINADTSMQWVVCDSDEENESWREISDTKVEPVGNRVMEHSLAELLDGIQNNNIMSKRNSSLGVLKNGKRLQQAVKRSASSLRDKKLDMSHESDRLSLGSSSHEEVSHQDRELFNPEKKKSIVDRFEEALTTATLSNEGSLFTGPKQSSNGLFGKLQLLVQSEKERDAGFIKKLLTGSIPSDVSHSITVKILSRYLEAKLTICVCSLSKGMKEASHPGSFIHADGGMKKTVVFNPRVCSHVDLEVGNWIHIHSPWKEIQVMGADESIILSSYFYQGRGDNAVVGRLLWSMAISFARKERCRRPYGTTRCT